MPAWNAYACPGSCYRTVYIQAAGGYTITRPDGTVISNQGSDFVNLATGTPYRIAFSGAAPNGFTVSYMDYDSGCLKPIMLQFASPGGGNRWDVAPGINVFSQACLGVKAPFPLVTQTRYLCDDSGVQLLQVTMGAAYTSTLEVLQGTEKAPPCSYLQCGVFMSQSQWSYNDSGTRPGDFLSAVLKPKNWKIGRGMFGFGGVGENTSIAYPGPSMVTTYFRQTFTLSQAGCINTLLFGYIADDAIVVYLNGAEIFRTNLPAAPAAISPGTPATLDVSPKAGWNTFNVTAENFWLESATNSLAVELHTVSAKALSARFDMWMAAAGENCPGSPFFSPNGVASSLTRVI